MKGISREVVPYSVDSVLDAGGDKSEWSIERMPGLDFYLDASSLDAQGIERESGACSTMRSRGWTATSPGRLNKPAQ